MRCQRNLKPPTMLMRDTPLFDPSNLVERKFFTGSWEEICSCLNKYFTNGLAPEQRLEMVKHYKRPDIPSMRVRSKLRRNEPANTPIHHIQDQNPVDPLGPSTNDLLNFSIQQIRLRKVVILDCHSPVLSTTLSKAGNTDAIQTPW